MRSRWRTGMIAVVAVAAIITFGVASREYHPLYHVADPAALVFPLGSSSSEWGYPIDFTTADVNCGGANREVILYGRTPGTADHFAKARSAIVSAAADASGVLNTEAGIKSGDTVGGRINMECDASEPTVTNVGVVPEDGYAQRLCDLGYTDPARLYLLVLDGSSGGYARIGACGNTKHARVAASVNILGSVAVSYLTFLHETLHLMGAVQTGAPGSDGASHCTDGRDVMCSSPQATNTACPDRMQVDCREDTYFDPTPEPGEWLTLHPAANLGLCSNPWTDCTYAGRASTSPTTKPLLPPLLSGG